MAFNEDALGDLFSELHKLQSQVLAAEEQAGTRSVEGSAGGGAVRVVASGAFSFDEVHIDTATLEVGDVTVLEDLVLAAVRDATSKLIEIRRSEMASTLSQALLERFAPDEDGAPDFETGIDRQDRDEQ